MAAVHVTSMMTFAPLPTSMSNGDTLADPGSHDVSTSNSNSNNHYRSSSHSTSRMTSTATGASVLTVQGFTSPSMRRPQFDNSSCRTNPPSTDTSQVVDESKLRDIVDAGLPEFHRPSIDTRSADPDHHHQPLFRRPVANDEKERDHFASLYSLDSKAVNPVGS